MENEKNKVEKSTLYLVGTPIGNLGDISDRAKKILSEVDFVACEDTRNTAKLLTLCGIRKELISYHEHNRASSGQKILARLIGGESCALVTDAGMPAISDPGEDIVKLCADAGIKVTTVPGPSALISALALSGLSTSKFFFEGFLPAASGARKKRIEELRFIDQTLIFYEAPHKLRATLADLAYDYGASRKISLCRELTKLNEEVIRTTLGAAVKLYETAEPRGEYVLVVEGFSNPWSNYNEDNILLSLNPDEHVLYYENMGYDRMDAIKAAAKDRGMTKSELYKIVNT